MLNSVKHLFVDWYIGDAQFAIRSFAIAQGDKNFFLFHHFLHHKIQRGFIG